MAWVIHGKGYGAVPEVGKVYQVRHSRKGAFTGRILSVRGEWADVEVVGGKARLTSDTANIIDKLRELRGEAQVVTIRDRLSYLIEIEPDDKDFDDLYEEGH
jgi:hypothetical protein